MSAAETPGRHRGLELALVGVAAVWGFTFPVVKDAVEVIPPFQFLAIRFGIAAALMTIVFGRDLRGFGLKPLLASAFAGVALFAGYAFQTVGSAEHPGLERGVHHRAVRGVHADPHGPGAAPASGPGRGDRGGAGDDRDSGCSR